MFTDDAREQLAAEIVERVAPDEAPEVRHAIALFRARNADRDMKRSAVNTLARILETHRTQLRANLFSRDEDALFQIANSFDIRHRNERQRTDYDAVFLD